MAMVSLKRYLTGERADPAALTAALLRFVQLTFQGIELNAVEGDKFEYQTFRDEIHSLAARLDAGADPGQLLVLAGEFNKCVEAYHRSVNRFIRLQSHEYFTIVSMLTHIVGDVSGATETSVARLHTIEHKLEQAAGSDDIRAARAQLAECLEGIRNERTRQVAAASDIKRNLELAVEQSATRLRESAAEPDVDSCTGLPTRRSAEAAIAECMGTSRHVYAVLFVLDRLQSINLRYGYGVGDQMLVRVCADLDRQLGTAAPRFRWGGPAILFLLDRPDPFPAVQSAMRRIVSRRMEESFAIDQRFISLTVTYSSAIVPLFQGVPAREIHSNLDQFAAASQLHPHPAAP